MTRANDTVMPFEIKPLGVRGRIVRLGAVIDDIVHRHDYPPAVSALLAEVIALTAMLGASLKFEGKFILQTKTDGPVDMIVADFASPNGVRGYARFNKKKLDKLKSPTQQDLLGKGYLAMTVDQGGDMERYQGIVPLTARRLLPPPIPISSNQNKSPRGYGWPPGPSSLAAKKPPIGGPVPSWCSICQKRAASAPFIFHRGTTPRAKNNCRKMTTG